MVFAQLAGMMIAYLGFFAGVLLAIISPEEMKPGKHWLELSASLLYGAIVGIAFLFFALEPLSYVHYGLAIFIILLILARLVKAGHFIIYTLLALMLALFLMHSTFFLLLAALILFYGLFEGSLLVLPHTKRKRLLTPKVRLFSNAWKQTWGYVFAVAVLFLVFLFF
jgi:hypothetical protein